MEGFMIGNGKNEFKEVLETDYTSYLILYYSHFRLVFKDSTVLIFTVTCRAPQSDRRMY